MPEMRRPMRVGEALYYALTGLSPRSEGKTTQGRVRDAIKRLMSRGEARTEGEAKRKIADRVGVSLRTVQRWAQGRQEARSASRDRLAAVQRAARIKPGRVELLASSAGPGGGLRIYGSVRVSEDERERWINVGSHLPEGSLDRVVELLAQDPDAAGSELNRLISAHYVPGMSVTTIEAIEYE